MLKNKLVLLIITFVLSRFLFLANYPHFYDSPEYLRESTGTSFFQSLKSSHESIHPVWLFSTQAFQKILSTSSAWEVSLVSATFGLIGFIAFYFLVTKLFSKETAYLSLIPLIFFPHLWLIQTNIMHESLDISLFLLGLLSWVYFLDKKNIYCFLTTILFLSLTIIDFLGMLIWFPALFGTTFLITEKKKVKNMLWTLLVISISIIFAILVLYKLLSVTTVEPLERLRLLIFGYGGQEIIGNLSFGNILRMFRNNMLVLLNGYGTISVLAGTIGALIMLKGKKYKELIFVLSFAIPFIITGRFWYGGLFGRYSVMVAYPLAVLIAQLNYSIFYKIPISLLIIGFVPILLIYQKNPIPIVQNELVGQISIQKDDLLVLSDFQRPQLTFDNAVYLNGDSNLQRELENKIDERLQSGNKVYISQQAIYYPYWQYDGQQIHIVSKGNIKKAQLKKYIETKNMKLVAQDTNYPLLNIYQIQ